MIADANLLVWYVTTNPNTPEAGELMAVAPELSAGPGRGGR